jgi:predicted DNA-binding transcriptional regulator YafY
MARPQGTGVQALRIVRILRRLDSGDKIPFSRTANEMGISERTLHRDVRLLRDAGEIISQHHDKFWLIKPKTLVEVSDAEEHNES